jgi:hypothetical protein
MSSINNLVIISAEQAKQEIFNRTDNLSLSKIEENIYLNYSDILEQSLNLPLPVFYGTLSAPAYECVNAEVIGYKKTMIFLTILNTSILFMWYNTEKHIYEFWGRHEQNLICAMEIIQKRIEEATNNMRIQLSIPIANVNQYYTEIPQLRKQLTTRLVSPLPVIPENSNTDENSQEQTINELSNNINNINLSYETPMKQKKTIAVPTAPLKRTYATVSAKPINGRKLLF